MEIMHRLQKSTGTGIGGSTVIGMSSNTIIGTDTHSSIGTGIGAGVHDVDYCLTTYGLVRFIDRTYVPDNSELKKVVFKEFHVKPYSGHPGYQKTLTAEKIFYYWSNLKRDVAEFVARCFNYYCLKAECMHPSELLNMNLNRNTKNYSYNHKYRDSA